MASKRRGHGESPGDAAPPEPRYRTFQVRFLASAAKAVRLLPARMREEVVRRAEGLASDPHPSGCEPIQGVKGLYRIRVGEYRVVYEVHKDRLLILVIRVGHRREVYRGF